MKLYANRIGGGRSFGCSGSLGNGTSGSRDRARSCGGSRGNSGGFSHRHNRRGTDSSTGRNSSGLANGRDGRGTRSGTNRNSERGSDGGCCRRTLGGADARVGPPSNDRVGIGRRGSVGRSDRFCKRGSDSRSGRSPGRKTGGLGRCLPSRRGCRCSCRSAKRSSGASSRSGSSAGACRGSRGLYNSDANTGPCGSTG